MADHAKKRCQAGDCTDFATAKAEWKFGKGVEIPFGDGGKCMSPVGMHWERLLCPTHVTVAIGMDSRPYKATATAWFANPDRHGLVIGDDGRLREKD